MNVKRNANLHSLRTRHALLLFDFFSFFLFFSFLLATDRHTCMGRSACVHRTLVFIIFYAKRSPPSLVPSYVFNCSDRARGVFVLPPSRSQLRPIVVVRHVRVTLNSILISFFCLNFGDSIKGNRNEKYITS